MLKGVVFDLDGTLVDSLSHSFSAFNHGFTQHGGKFHQPEEIMAYFGPGEGDIFTRVLGTEKAAAAYDSYRKFFDEKIGEMPLHKGVEELLTTLEANRIPFSIFTGRGWDTTELILKHHRILDRFITVVSSDHVNLSKPSPEGLHLALSRMKMQPKEVLFVGDSSQDIRAAHLAKSIGVAALWDSRASREELALQKPHYWAGVPMEIWEIFSADPTNPSRRSPKQSTS